MNQIYYESSTPSTVDSESENMLPEPPIENMESSTDELTKDDNNNSKYQSESDPDWLSRIQS